MILRDLLNELLLDRPGTAALTLCALGLALAGSIPLVAPWWAGEAHLPQVLRGEATEQVAESVRFFASLLPMIGAVVAALMSHDPLPGQVAPGPSISLVVCCLMLAVAINYSGAVLG